MDFTKKNNFNYIVEINLKKNKRSKFFCKHNSLVKNGRIFFHLKQQFQKWGSYSFHLLSNMNNFKKNATQFRQNDCQQSEFWLTSSTYDSSIKYFQRNCFSQTILHQNISKEFCFCTLFILDLVNVLRFCTTTFLLRIAVLILIPKYKKILTQASSIAK